MTQPVILFMHFLQQDILADVKWALARWFDRYQTREITVYSADGRSQKWMRYIAPYHRKA